MIVYFNERIQWQNVPANLMGLNKLFMAAPAPHLVTLVIMPAVRAVIGGDTANLYKETYDCSIGSRDGIQYTDFVLPQFAGYRHTEITIRSRRPLQQPTKLLSEIMGQALPLGTEERNETWHGVHTALKVPNALWVAANELATKKFGDQPQAITDFVNSALLYYIENHD